MRVWLLALWYWINPPKIIIDFKPTLSLRDWYITNDTVMGGVSNSSITLDENGNGCFSGTVSIENNGGFAMVKHPTEISCEGAKKIILKIKGDGKNYQLRLKSNRNQRFWYIQSFYAKKGWQTISLELNGFYPSFRGRKLNSSNFSGNTIEEIALLIGNKKTENFNLLIDRVTLK